MADLLVLLRSAKSVQNGTGFSRETGRYWACRKGKSGLSATERVVGKNAGAALAKKEKEQSRLSRVPDHEGGESQGGESRTLVRKRGIRAGAWRGKGELDREGRQIPSRKGRASNKSLPRTSRRKHERVSGRKSSLKRSA